MSRKAGSQSQLFNVMGFRIFVLDGGLCRSRPELLIGKIPSILGGNSDGLLMSKQILQNHSDTINVPKGKVQDLKRQIQSYLWRSLGFQNYSQKAQYRYCCVIGIEFLKPNGRIRFEQILTIYYKTGEVKLMTRQANKELPAALQAIRWPNLSLQG